MRTNDRTYYDTGTGTSVHQVPTQPCDYNYNYCPHRLPCGICRLTNQSCGRLTNTIQPIWTTLPTIITCEV